MVGNVFLINNLMGTVMVPGLKHLLKKWRSLLPCCCIFGLVDVASFQRYWSTMTLYHGLWARSIMSRNRFKAIMGMLHVVDPFTEDDKDKLRKVRSLVEHFKERCMALYQPYREIAIDERMVRSKHHSGIRQYIKNNLLNGE